MDTVDLSGKTAIVTGSNTGIGYVTALVLANKGARVILACRNREKGEAACREIITKSENNNVELKILDLSSFSSVRKFAEDFNTTEARLDILVNNAGVFTRERSVTEDGNEVMLQVNHLGHFLLTYMLLDKLKSSAPSRIVNVASLAHEFRGKVDFKDIQCENFSTLKAYGRSKTANILHAVHLADLLKDSGVTTYALHPGVVDTDLPREFGESCCFSCCIRFLSCLSCQKFMTSEEGAQTTLYCCLEPSLASQSGLYYVNSRIKSAKRHAVDKVIARKLWDVSMDLCGL